MCCLDLCIIDCCKNVGMILYDFCMISVRFVYDNCVFYLLYDCFIMFYCFVYDLCMIDCLDDFV